MGYLHIPNLYKSPEILYCYALEKIHGTSAHIAFRRENGKSEIRFFSGGEKHEKFVNLFAVDELSRAFNKQFPNDGEVVLYGEAFGGKQQGMSATYGPNLRFMVFDVKIDDVWLDVPSAVGLTNGFGLEFVPYQQGPLSLEFLNQERDRDSLVAITAGKMREGIVIRPLREYTKNNGDRFIYKHKRDDFKETATPREVSLEQAAILTEASAIADEWVTPMRLQHVLQKTPFNGDEDTGAIIRAMVEDVRRESEGEAVWSKEVQKAISRKTAQLLRSSQLAELNV